MATDEQIKTAFNAGYTMQKYDSATVDKLLATDNDNEIVQAVKQGAKQFHKEKIAQEQQAIKQRVQANRQNR